MEFKKITILFLFLYMGKAKSMEGHLVGIQNQGQTCFMNSTLQCLYHTQGLTQFLTKEIEPNFYKPNSVATQYLKFLEMYSKALENNQNEAIIPIEWCNKIWSLEELDLTRSKTPISQFPIGAQGDAREFLGITLGHLGLDNTKSDIAEEKISERMSYPLQKLPKNRLIDILSSIIKGFNNNGLINSIKSESSMTLNIVKEFTNLGEPKTFVSHLSEAIKNHFTENKHTIFKLPEYLPITLKIFTENLQKIHAHIPFPQELNLTEFLDSNAPEQNGLYELYGAVIHHGTAVNSGHYTAFIKINNKWYTCSDSSCSETSVGQVENSNPYILFYQQKIPTENFVYKKIDLAKAEENIKNVISILPTQLKSEIDSLKSTIKINTNLLQTNAENLKKTANIDKKYKAPTRYEYYQEENKAYVLAIPILEGILEKGNIEDYFNQYLAQEKITREDLRKSIEIQLTDTNYLISRISNFIAESAKEEARKELYEPSTAQLSHADAIQYLQNLNNSLIALSSRKEALSK